jgi:HlyD family secretion protein
MRKLALLVAAAALSACGRGDRNVLVASGTVEATDAQLGFQAAGRVAEIRVREGDAVQAAQLLGMLDRTETEARRRQSDAQLAAARARLEELTAGPRREEIAQARAAADAAEKRSADAAAELARSQRLFDGGAISKEAYDKAVLGRDVAASQRDQAAEQLALLERGYRKEQIEAARAQVAQAEASLAAADAALKNMVIEAPFAGVVTLRHREPGEVVAAGAPIVTLMNPEDRWVRIYVREDRIGAVKVGGKASIRCDTFPGKSYEGAVTFVASEAEFTPKTVQTTEERVKLVYAVKVSVKGDGAGDLKPGMPADVTLDLASQPAAATARSGS